MSPPTNKQYLCNDSRVLGNSTTYTQCIWASYVLNSLLLSCFVQWYKAPNDYSCNVFVLPQRSNVTPVRVEGPPQLNITPVMYLTLQGAKRLLLYCFRKACTTKSVLLYCFRKACTAKSILLYCI